mmetsp:Transcript_32726/g.53081  ORF Transcript_32726/g.53081 Transcript_32726/m.53081 type:complete len:93 (-) Transcript_32726:4158-4436(-)
MLELELDLFPLRHRSWPWPWRTIPDNFRRDRGPRGFLAPVPVPVPVPLLVPTPGLTPARLLFPIVLLLSTDWAGSSRGALECSECVLAVLIS